MAGIVAYAGRNYRGHGAGYGGYDYGHGYGYDNGFGFGCPLLPLALVVG